MVYDLSSDPSWMNQIKLPQELITLIDTPFDMRGEYKHQEPTFAVPQEEDTPKSELEAQTNELEPDIEETTHRRAFFQCFKAASALNETDTPLGPESSASIDDRENQDTLQVIKPIKLEQKPIDYQKYRPHLLHSTIEKIKRTFDATTQHASNVMAGHIITQTAASPFQHTM